MQMIGRKLVFDFGKTVIAIEIYPKINGEFTRYKVPHEKTALLFDICESLGEHVEIKKGESAKYCYGADMNGHMPSESPEAWMAVEEKEKANEVKL